MRSAFSENDELHTEDNQAPRNLITNVGDEQPDRNGRDAWRALVLLDASTGDGELGG